MICRYETKLVAICPIHKVLDHYDLTIESPHQIYVEEIIAFLKTCGGKEETQEQITGTIATKFGCRVVTVGYHSGVKTTVTA